jgi:rare lipoprotein A
VCSSDLPFRFACVIGRKPLNFNQLPLRSRFGIVLFQVCDGVKCCETARGWVRQEARQAGMRSYKWGALGENPSGPLIFSGFDMFLLKNKMIRAVFFVGITAATFFAWFYVRDLRIRYPEIDFYRARLGIASWYSETDKYIQKHTANGEVFNDKAMTCASWHYPFGEKLLVIIMLNGRWVVCRVNDRGPAKYLRREIDLTKAAFGKIANPDIGLILTAVIPVHRPGTKTGAGGPVARKKTG